MSIKQQDISSILKEAGTDPRVVRVILQQQEMIKTLQQEVNGICQGLDRIIEHMNNLATVAGVHQQMFKGLEAGKSMSDVIASMRAEHLDGQMAAEPAT